MNKDILKTDVIFDQRHEGLQGGEHPVAALALGLRHRHEVM